MSGKQDLTRQEEFKRATAGALRAIAHADPEVQVAFQPGPSGVAGKPARCSTSCPEKCIARFNISLFPIGVRAKTGMAMPICISAFPPATSLTDREAQDQTRSQHSARTWASLSLMPVV